MTPPRVELGSEHGAIVVLVALLIPVLVLMASFAVDLSSFFVHKRQLQIRADAAALAGAGDLADQIEADAGCSADDVGAAVYEYGRTRNPSGFGEEAEARTDDPTVNAEPGLSGDPCADALVDVTVRQRDVPWYFSVTRLLTEIKARARVEIQTIGTQTGTLPIAVPIPPDGGEVRVRDLDSGAVRAAPLAEAGTDADGRKLFEASFGGLAIDRRSTVDVTLGTIDYPAVGYIRGWEAPDSRNQDPPGAGVVRLETNAGSCGADAFSRPYYFASAATCLVGLSAKVDFNDEVPAGEVAAQKVIAVAGGARYELAYDAASGLWRRAAADVAIPAKAGAVAVDLDYEQFVGRVGGTAKRFECKAKSPCTGTIASTVARPHSAPADTIGRLEIQGTDPDTGQTYVSGFNTVRRGSAPDVVVRVGVTSNLSLGGGVRTLRLSALNQNFAVNCGVFEEALEHGCEQPYQVNQRGDACAPELDPPDCVAPETGNRESQIAKGMEDRILGADGVCQASERNHYATGIEDGDPRLAPVTLVPFDSFQGTGGDDRYPVKGFAWFYITGWTDQHGDPGPCEGDEFPAGWAPGTQKAHLYGRYVKRLDHTGPGQIGSGTRCEFTDVYGCIAVMTH